jgi:hypothetical protein
MKNNELQQLLIGLNRAKQLKGVKFAYAISKNITILEREIKALNKLSEPSPEFMEYDKKRLSVCSEFADKDKNGNPVIQQGNFLISERSKFDKAMAKLKKEHKEAYDNHAKKLEEFDELMEEEANIELFKVSLEVVPDDINGEVLHSIMPIIND